MTSDQPTTVSGAQEAYVWMWLPNQTQPVVIGHLYDAGESPQRYFFTYGRSYLERPNAMPLSPYELPLKRGPQEPQGLNRIPCCIRDGGPDAWGRRVLESTYGETSLTELDYFLLSRSDRIGALDFQAFSSNYHPRTSAPVTMENLLQAAELVEKRQPLPPELEQAALHGSSVGGARPKVLIENGPLPSKADLLRAGAIALEDGSEFLVAIGDKGTCVNYESCITEPDDRARNGVVHYVDDVIEDDPPVSR
jgi:serine/threonine-protein kinase HipA